MPQCQSHLGRELDAVYRIGVCPTCQHESQYLVGYSCPLDGKKFDPDGTEIEVTA